ncbi:alpha/beta fold hydrolase [Mycolicibacterium komossense]|uniref:Alpha/beta fold hydrolase n=1 Tax=Mycolicibacterium komossense TaxID=1779 RepID=A0ABT3C704_9MYCO|nr:alpha/beta fold hydrolase [Mycolicibacterium komossense]MCV7225253.1 alpha/beta fold hydrolase [Mycolicibacterium komossense]
MDRRIYVERGNARLAVQLFESQGADSVVVIVPAMGAAARSYRRFAEALRDTGRDVAVMDLRGTGESTPSPGRESDYDYADLTEDVDAVLTALREEARPGSRTLLLGHSLGGLAAIAHVARTGGQYVDGLVLVASGIPYWRDYGSRAWSAHLLRMYVLATVAIVGYWNGIGFGGPQSAGVMRDWAHTSRTGELPPHLGVVESIGEVRVPILVLTVDGDKHTPPPVVDRLVSLLKSAPIGRKHITSDEAGTALDHFRWLKAPDVIAQAVGRWESAG